MPFFQCNWAQIFLSSKTRESGFDRDSWCMVASLAVGWLFLTRQQPSFSGLNIRRKAVRTGSIIGLLFAAAIFATAAPISRRDFRQTRRAVRRGAF
jgi:hypothetical protein